MVVTGAKGEFLITADDGYIYADHLCALDVHEPDPEASADTVPDLPQPLTLLRFDGSAVNHENRSIAILKPQQCLAKALSQLARMSVLAEALYLDPD